MAPGRKGRNKHDAPPESCLLVVHSEASSDAIHDIIRSCRVTDCNTFVKSNHWVGFASFANKMPYVMKYKDIEGQELEFEEETDERSPGIRGFGELVNNNLGLKKKALSDKEPADYAPYSLQMYRILVSHLYVLRILASPRLLVRVVVQLVSTSKLPAKHPAIQMLTVLNDIWKHETHNLQNTLGRLALYLPAAVKAIKDFSDLDIFVRAVAGLDEEDGLDVFNRGDTSMDVWLHKCATSQYQVYVGSEEDHLGDHSAPFRWSFASLPPDNAPVASVGSSASGVTAKAPAKGDDPTTTSKRTTATSKPTPEAEEKTSLNVVDASTQTPIYASTSTGTDPHTYPGTDVATQTLTTSPTNARTQTFLPSSPPPASQDQGIEDPSNGITQGDDRDAAREVSVVEKLMMQDPDLESKCRLLQYKRLEPVRTMSF
ncbi:hypothetical protein FKW77_003906 [Venturia effusa]|uniref:Uncharacterized protein n=1 Tax=Venturia effusa TaxID=50376 RepID=A0A517KZA4_9PEZI|nr:hypothetical protein FKW77_003906 [Venturia effusa]